MIFLLIISRRRIGEDSWLCQCHPGLEHRTRGSRDYHLKTMKCTLKTLQPANLDNNSAAALIGPVTMTKEAEATSDPPETLSHESPNGVEQAPLEVTPQRDYSSTSTGKTVVYDKVSQESRDSDADLTISSTSVSGAQPPRRDFKKIQSQLYQSVDMALQEDACMLGFDPRQLIDRMSDLGRLIPETVATLLRPYARVEFTELNILTTQSVTELSKIVFGHSSEKELVDRAYGIQSQQNLDPGNVLRAYIAAALTHWVFRVDIREQESRRDIRGLCELVDFRRQRLEDWLQKGSLQVRLAERYMTDIPAAQFHLTYGLSCLPSSTSNSYNVKCCLLCPSELGIWRTSSSTF